MDDADMQGASLLTHVLHDGDYIQLEARRLKDWIKSL